MDGVLPEFLSLLTGFTGDLFLARISRIYCLRGRMTEDHRSGSSTLFNAEKKFSDS